MAVDAWGQIVVADTGNNRVVALDTQGNFLTEFTEPNDGYTGPFNAPRGVAVEPDGDLVVADTGNGRVVTACVYLAPWLPGVDYTDLMRRKFAQCRREAHLACFRV